MKVFQLTTSGETDTICAENVIQALKHYEYETGISLLDYESDDDIVEVPRDQWANHIFTSEDDREDRTLEELMNGQDEPAILGNTAY